MQSLFQTYRKPILFAAAILALALILFVIKGQMNAPPPPVNDVEIKANFMNTLQSAEDQLIQKLEQNAKDIPSTIALINALMQQTEYDKAIDVANKSLASNPDNADILQHRTMAYFAKGMYLSEKGKLQDGLAAMKKARETSPEDAPYTKQIEAFIYMIEVKIDPKKAREQQQKKKQ
jgi:tetratricopeptide (TPR) repeat protein